MSSAMNDALGTFFAGGQNRTKAERDEEDGPNRWSKGTVSYAERVDNELRVLLIYGPQEERPAFRGGRRIR